MVDFAAMGARAAAEGKDMTKAVAGGDYTPPKAGPCRVRFVGYVEVGKHTKLYKGVSKTADKVWMYFEVSGPNHPPREHEGKKYPTIIKVEENLSLNDKANFKKLFTRMNYGGKAQHMIQLLGEAYLATIVHREWKGSDGKPRIEAELRGPEGYTIKPPRFEDPETGAERVVSVDPAITPLRGFLWEYPDDACWSSLFIEGQYEERKDDKGVVIAPAKSKNMIQNKIKTAVNFQGSPVATFLLEKNGGAPLDVPDAESPDEDDGPPWDGEAPTPQAAPKNAATGLPDPLAGVA